MAQDAQAGIDVVKGIISPPPSIYIRRLVKTYRMGRTEVHALRGVDLKVMPGEMVAIMGPSGSGKSTLMNILGCLDRSSAGDFLLDGVPVSQMSKADLADIRNQKLGFVFQNFNLLSWMSAASNVELPLVYAGMPAEQRQKRVQWALRLVGLGSRMNHRPLELSGGQQQRVAIARALVTDPALILADEPTGNLDTRTSIEIMMILQKLNERGMTVIMVTHEQDIANYCKRRVVLRDGKIMEDSVNPHPLNAQEQFAALKEKKVAQ